MAGLLGRAKMLSIRRVRASLSAQQTAGPAPGWNTTSVRSFRNEPVEERKLAPQILRDSHRWPCSWAQAPSTAGYTSPCPAAKAKSVRCIGGHPRSACALRPRALRSCLAAQSNAPPLSLEPVIRSLSSGRSNPREISGSVSTPCRNVFTDPGWPPQFNYTAPDADINFTRECGRGPSQPLEWGILLEAKRKRVLMQRKSEG